MVALSIGQERHDTPPFQIADDRPVAMVAAEGPVVDTDHAQRSDVSSCTTPDDAQQRIVADRQHEPLGEGRGGSTAES